MLAAMQNRVTIEPPREITALFPSEETAIRMLFNEDEAFRELCADYTDCVAALDRLQKDQAGVSARIDEYEELRVNLEKDLANWISAHIT